MLSISVFDFLLFQEKIKVIKWKDTNCIHQRTFHPLCMQFGLAHRRRTADNRTEVGLSKKQMTIQPTKKEETSLLRAKHRQ